MREWLGRVTEYVNRWEAEVVARGMELPPDPPASAVTALTEIARGGLLWLGIATALTARPLGAGRAARDGVVAVPVASASSHLIKWWLPRRRPAADHLPARQALLHPPTSSSFPSAHAATAAAFTTAAACESPATGLVVAAAVAYPRLRTRVHWPSDVVAARCGEWLLVWVPGACYDESRRQYLDRGFHGISPVAAPALRRVIAVPALCERRGPFPIL